MSILAHAVAYAHPNREVLFQQLHFSVPTGSKAALVGNNGLGKSTLLRLLAGQLLPTAGQVTVSAPPYYVPQHLGQYDACTVAQALGVADKLRALRAILAGDAAAEHFATLHDDWNLEERVQAALEFWHLPPLCLQQPLHTLSGGEKTKVFLAGALVQQANLLLLDEPSNHLDAASRHLLYDFVRRSPATVLVVSHDRALLNLLPLTLELTPAGVEAYGGNYDFYRAQKDAKLTSLQAQLDDKAKTLHQARQKAREVAEQRHKQEARGKAQGQKKALPRIVAGGLKRQAQQSSAHLQEVHADKISGLAQGLQQVRSQVQEHAVLKIELAPSGLHRGKTLVEARAINFAYGAEPLWPAPLSFQVRSGDRVRLAGRNGVGKSTLLRLMTGQVRPTSGEIFVADLDYFYIDQDYSGLDNALTVFAQVQRFNSRGLLEHELKTVLHYQQFGRDAWDRPTCYLSGGEKLKLLLCCLLVRNHAPDLLILDEPTNNLDVQSQETLTEAVKHFTGSVLLISHDQYVVDAIGVDTSIHLDGKAAR